MVDQNNKLFVIREISINVLVAIYYACFAYLHARYYLRVGATTTLLFLVYESLLIFLALFRRLPKDVSFSLRDWVVAGIGTYMPLMLISSRGEFPGDTILLALQAVGVAISFMGMVSLNRSYGTVPANRGVRTKGLYAYVRHPVYAGYFISLTCFALQNLPYPEITLWNLGLLAFILTAMVLRIRYEEELLMKDEEYRQFATQTRYRILPGVW